MKFTITLLTLLLSQVVLGSTVAIIDSGTDMLHKDIYGQAWINPGEVANNQSDDDQNGYMDDVYGWNFAEDNNKVIDYSYLGRLTADVRKFFNIQDRMIRGIATEADITWMKDIRNNEEFIKNLQIYGNFMHGTHVAGISAKKAIDAEIMAIKLIPTEVKLPFPMPGQNEKNDQIKLMLLNAALSALAKQQMKSLETIAQYINAQGADIANGSFGTGFAQAKMIVGMLFPTIMGREPSEDELYDTAKGFMDNLLRAGDHFIAAAPNTLFVFAAGNDGTNNDKFPTSPTNIQAANVISVAATLDNKKLASFSNFGKKMVDIAAPGVGIESPVPGNQYLKVSGTSQAAPYVTNIAAKLKDANSDLAPVQLKKILMKTVDHRQFLEGKVLSAGLVNGKRAVFAANLSKTMSLDTAIAQSMTQIQDQSPKEESVLLPAQGGSEIVLPLPSVFKF